MMAADPVRFPSPPRGVHVEPLLTHSRVLGARLALHAWVRAVVVVLMVLGTLTARYLLGIDVHVGALLALAAFIGVYDVVVAILSRRQPPPGDDEQITRRHRALMHAAILLDYLGLTAAIWLIGGARSPFLTLYIIHVGLGCLLLTRRAAIAFTAIAYGLLVALVSAEWFALLPPYQPAGAVAGAGPLDGRYVVTVLFVNGILLWGSAFLFLTLAARLRDGERRVREANERLSRLSTLRRDFLDITTHNLRSPLGVVNMFLQNLRDELGGPLAPTQREWVERCLLRLESLDEFLRDLKMLSALESGELEGQATDVNIAKMLAGVVEEHEDLARARDHGLQLDLPPALPPARGIERLLREAVANYVTNAIKYTPPGGRITIRAKTHGSRLRIEVEDNGIGIAPEDQGRLFRDFTRLSTPEAAMSGAAGSGLGLSITRRIIDAHGGTVDVRSAPGRGSTFGLEVPRA